MKLNSGAGCPNDLPLATDQIEKAVLAREMDAFCRMWSCVLSLAIGTVTDGKFISNARRTNGTSKVHVNTGSIIQTTFIRKNCSEMPNAYI